MISTILIADILRFVVLGLFGATIGETAAIFWAYSKVAKSTRRLLPIHIAMVSAGLMMLELYVAIKTVGYIDTPFSWLIPYNIVALGLVYASLVLVRIHISRKRTAHNKIDSLLEDEHSLP